MSTRHHGQSFSPVFNARTGLVTFLRAKNPNRTLRCIPGDSPSSSQLNRPCDDYRLHPSFHDEQSLHPSYSASISSFIARGHRTRDDPTHRHLQSPSKLRAWPDKKSSESDTASPCTIASQREPAMFSSINNGIANGASTPANSTRGRRRQRPVSNDESVRQPKAKRARIPLNEQTFAPEANQETYQVKAARPSIAARKQDGIEDVENSSPQAKKELSFRSKKAKTADRLTKGDGSVVLVCLHAVHSCNFGVSRH